jgi:hypothetical protein
MFANSAKPKLSKGVITKNCCSNQFLNSPVFQFIAVLQINVLHHDSVNDEYSF